MVIIGYGETLLRSDQSMDDRIEAVNTVISSGEHLLNLINDILDVSKIEAQKLVLDKSEISPFRVVHEVEQIVSGQARRKNVQFSIEYDFPLPSVIFSDHVRLKQILLNLCANAIKFTNRGYIRVTMRYENTLDMLFFIVQDSGIGMTEETIAVVFDSFTQADSSTTRKYGGTGLGLTLSKQLALLLGGDIDVDSKMGIGSTFALHIPAQKNTQTAMVYDYSDIPTFTIETEKLPCIERLSGKVLIAEDNINNQKLVKRHLEKMGLEVTAVDNGKRAVDTALTGEFDLVFMDIQMPVMGGLEAVKTLRNGGFTKPVVALTANALQEDRDRCLSVGCNDYATKPIHYEQLYHIARQYVTVAPAAELQEPLYSSIMAYDEDYQKLVNSFIDELRPTANKISEYYSDEDWDALTDIIHQLKGLGGGYGFPEITEVSAKIGFQLASRNFPEVGKLLDELLYIVERIELGRTKVKTEQRKLAGT